MPGRASQGGLKKADLSRPKLYDAVPSTVHRPRGGAGGGSGVCRLDSSGVGATRINVFVCVCLSRCVCLCVGVCACV